MMHFTTPILFLYWFLLFKNVLLLLLNKMNRLMRNVIRPKIWQEKGCRVFWQFFNRIGLIVENLTQ
jgi:hypothetical protein